MNKTKVISGLLAGAGVATVAGALWWRQQLKRPTETALMTNRDSLRQKEGWYFPSLQEKLPMVIVIPEALVAGEAYSLWVSNLAKAGYPVFVLDSLLPSQAIKKAEAILRRFPHRSYVLVGHGIGGELAATLANERLLTNDARLKGTIYLGALPLYGENLQSMALPALVVTGSQDKKTSGRISVQEEQLYPTNTTFVSINGGDHLGFASVCGHRPKALPAQLQQKQLTEILLQWLEQL